MLTPYTVLTRRKHSSRSLFQNNMFFQDRPSPKTSKRSAPKFPSAIDVQSLRNFRRRLRRWPKSEKFRGAGPFKTFTKPRMRSPTPQRNPSHSFLQRVPNLLFLSLAHISKVLGNNNNNLNNVRDEVK